MFLFLSMLFLLLIFIMNFTFPVKTCPKDTSYYLLRGTRKLCSPGNPNDCPRSHFCHYHTLEKRHYCCGKRNNEYCRSGKVAVTKNKIPLTCRVDNSRTCPQPLVCERLSRTSGIGYCCRPIFEMEPPPTGCPWGTRPLRGQNHQKIHCMPGSAHVCPGNSICYHDSLAKTYGCCGKDPGEGCPSGTKPLKQDGQHISCVPGDSEQECPGFSICQWNYMTDHYQCCAPDNGCPDGMVPAFLSENIAQMCNKDDRHSCPIQHTCEFNFWISSYQCCGPDVDHCPPSKVPYFESGTMKVRPCPHSMPQNFCPPGYNCELGTNQRHLCCGVAGQCPDGLQVEMDEQHNVKSCSPFSTINSCAAGSSCLQALGGSSNHYLCCDSATTDGHCPRGYTAEMPQNVIKCSPSTPFTNCRSGSQCLQSVVDRRIFLCCTQLQSQCPPGYLPPGGPASSPFSCVNSNDCPMNSVCLPAVGRPNAKVCCSQMSDSSEHCGFGGKLQNNMVSMCSSNQPCSSGSSFCISSQRNPTLRICCVYDFYTIKCPAGYSSGHQNGQWKQCDFPTNYQCPFGSVCTSAANIPQIKICCVTSSNLEPVCPFGFSLQNRKVNYCDPFKMPCSHPDAQCTESVNDRTTSICCILDIPVVEDECPNNQVPYLKGKMPHLCQTSKNCPVGYQCVQSINSVNYICCKHFDSNKNYFCTDETPAASNSFGQTIFCSLDDENVCPPNYSCTQSASDRMTFICCQTSALCPDGQLPVVEPSGRNDLTCKPCPQSSSCQKASNMANTFICCLDTRTVAMCPVNFKPVYSPTQSGTCTNYNCHEPNVCLQRSSIDTNVKICCEPLRSNQVCQQGFKPLMYNGFYAGCPGVGLPCLNPSYTCYYSPVLSMGICCTRQLSSHGDSCLLNEEVLYLNGRIKHCSLLIPGHCGESYDCLFAESLNASICCHYDDENLHKWKCISGRNPYPNPTSPLPCNPSASKCPKGTGCELSLTQDHFICCDADIRKPQCPANWERQVDGGLHYRKCLGSSDVESCSKNYVCLPSDIPTIRICCKFREGATCALSKKKPFLQRISQPFECTNSSSCPVGFSCQPSSDHFSTFCCEDITPLSQFALCHNGGNPYGTRNDIFICGSKNICPKRYFCQKSANKYDGICCPNQKDDARHQVCQFGQLPLLVNGRPMKCDMDDHYCQSDGYHCQQSVEQFSEFYCCQKPKCSSNAKTILLANGHPRYCNPSFSFSCPPGSFCEEAVNMPGNYICCAKSTDRMVVMNRCIGRMTHLLQGIPVQCSIRKSHLCPPATECSDFTTQGTMICCMSAARSLSCPHGDPYLHPVTKHYHYCSSTDYTCPFGYICRKVNDFNNGLYICCSNPRTCQIGWKPLTLAAFGTQPDSVADCNPSMENSCPPPYKCQQSTVPGEYICCVES